MAAKLKVKVKAKIKARPKATGKSKVVKAKIAKQRISKPSIKGKPTRKLMTKTNVIKEKPVVASIAKSAVVEAPVVVKLKPAMASKAVAPVVKRPVNPLVERRRPAKRSSRGNQFNFMKAPELESAFDVGDTVEVFCDHDKNKERIRGWIKGIVVQVDHKMVAVQFRSNVYLTDGWMVPDRILWYPVNSEHIRAVPGKKIAKDKLDFIPDY